MKSLSFTEHPASVGETYCEHLVSAFHFSFDMICGGVACFVHGLFPFLFMNAGSSKIRSLHERMILNRGKVQRTISARPFDEHQITGHPSTL
jgi:hypothetical protein